MSDYQTSLANRPLRQRTYHPSITQNLITPGSITSHVLRLASETVQEITRQDEGKRTLDDYIKMMERDPVARSCAELKALRATTAFGKYEHPSKTLQEWIQHNLDFMDSNLNAVIGQIAGSSMCLGFAVAEIVFGCSIKKQWRIKALNILDPRRVSFEGKKGSIKYVIYKDYDGRRKRIPYSKCIHVVAGYSTNFNDPFGSGEAKRAYPFYQAKQTVLAEMTIAAKNNATGIWVGFTDSNDQVQLFGADGKPLKDVHGNDLISSSTESLLRQLQNIENSSVVVTDLKNRIEPRQIGAGEQFWNLALTYLNQSITQAFQLPPTIFNETHGLLGGSVANVQKTVLDATIEAVVKQIKDEVLMKVVRPLLYVNFGHHEHLGDFNEVVINDQQTRASILQNIVSATSMQLVPADDPDILNKVRDLLDLPLKDTEELEAKKAEQAQMQQIMQMLSAQQPQPGQSAPNFGQYAEKGES